MRASTIATDKWFKILKMWSLIFPLIRCWWIKPWIKACFKQTLPFWSKLVLRLNFQCERGDEDEEERGRRQQHQPLASKNSSSELSMDSCAMFCRHQWAALCFCDEPASQKKRKHTRIRCFSEATKVALTSKQAKNIVLSTVYSFQFSKSMNGTEERWEMALWQAQRI